MKHTLETVMQTLQRYLELPHEHPNKIFLATENELRELQKELRAIIKHQDDLLSKVPKKLRSKRHEIAIEEVLGVEPKVKEETKR